MLLALLPLALAADPTFTPEAQYRPRFEADSGRDGVAGEGDVAFVTHRARLGATLAAGPVEARLVFQDVRAWGEELDTRHDFSADGLDLAIGTVTWQLQPGLRLILGRGELVVHEERLVARAGWRQPGRHFDGGRLLWEGDGWGAEAGGFLSVDGDAFQLDEEDQVLPDRGDQTLWFARGGLEAEGRVAQGIVVVDSRQERAGAELLRVTSGVFMQADGPLLFGQAEVYGQLGWMDGGDQRVRAGMASGTLGVSPALPGAPRAALAVDWLSGDGAPDDGRFTAFHTVRGANHRYYGHMDIATFLRGGEIEAQGLIDPRLSLGLSPAPHLQLTLDQHLFMPAAVAPGAARWLAVEPDLALSWRAQPGVTLSAGASAWAEAARPAEWWGWVMLDVALTGPVLHG